MHKMCQKPVFRTKLGLGNIIKHFGHKGMRNSSCPGCLKTRASVVIKLSHPSLCLYLIQTSVESNSMSFRKVELFFTFN